jgi:fumarate hydratase subunit beta
VRHLNLPPSKEELAILRVGDEVLLSGPLFTMRDAGHERALAALEATGNLPFGLAGHVLFYAGPTPPAAGRSVGAVGPTTASRMDFATPQLFASGITAAIGKGTRNAAVHEACLRWGCVYFAAVGGAAAYLATCVKSLTPIAWADLGTEALVRFDVEDFPVFVAIDVEGNDLYDQVVASADSETHKEDGWTL